MGVRRGQVTWLVTHWAGCLLYFIALQEGAGVRTWLDLKPDFVASLGSFERRARAGPHAAGHTHPLGVPRVGIHWRRQMLEWQAVKASVRQSWRLISV